VSTVTLRIQVDKTGANENIDSVKRGLNDMGQEGAESGARAAGGVNSLRGAFDQCRAAVGLFLGVYAGIQTLSGVARLSDEYQSLTARIDLATGGGNAFVTAQQGVYAIAQETSTALSAVGGLYVSLANSNETLNLSQGELLTLTGAVSQSLVLSGASAGSAQAVVNQLAQAFGSGVLRGDEFNSMMEGSPRLATALATALGVTKGQLRDMAEEGQLTSKVLAEGLLQQAPELAREFTKMGTTIGGAFTQLSNALLKFIGEAGQSTGAASAFAGVIVTLAGDLPAFILGLSSVAGGYIAIKGAALAANPQIAFTTTVLGGLATALGLLISAYAAFKLGEYLADEFQIVREAGANLVIGLNAVWLAIRLAFEALVIGMRLAFTLAIDLVQEKIADVLESFVALAKFEIFGTSVDFTYGQAAALDDLVRALRDSTGGAGATDAAMGELTKKFDDSKTASDNLKRGLEEATQAHFDTKGATEGLTGAQGTNRTATDNVTGAITGLKGAAEAANPKIAEMKAAMEAASGASDQLRDMQEDLTAEVAGPAYSAYLEYARKLREVDALEIALTASQGLSKKEAQDLTTYRNDLAASLVRNITEINNAVPAEQAYLAELREEIRLAGLSESARELGTRRIEAEKTARGLLTGATDEQVRALTDEILRLGDLKAAAEAQSATAQDWADYWEGASGEVARAIGDLVANGLDDFSEFGDALQSIAKKIVSDLVTEFAQLSIINPILNSILGGVRPTGGSALGNLFGGGGGSSGGLLGGILGTFGGAPSAGLPSINLITGASGTMGAGGAGGLGGLGAMGPFAAIAAAVVANFMLMRQGWGATGGSLTLPDGQVVRGGGSGSARGLDNLARAHFGLFGLSDTAAGILSGSAIHNRLFGRQAPKLTDSTTSFNFGADGAGADLMFRTIERGGVFRSDRRRTRTGQVDDETLDAAQSMFDEVQATMTNAARNLQSTAPQMLESALRVVQQYDGDGKVKATQFFVDMLGESWEEASSEAALTRISAENLVATIDAAVGGGVSEIAQRWRGDAGVLMDGAQFLLGAAVDIRAGVGLLGSEGGLADVVDLTESLRIGSESLVDTYTRLRIGVTLVDGALGMLGGVFGGTREQAVLFSSELIAAAGGMDQFAAKLQGALEVLFSEEERAQFTADQAQAALNAALTGLNITGTGLEDVRQQLRTQLRAAMEAGNVELTNQILTAANALGAFGSALEALGEDAVDAANSTTFGGTTVAAASGPLTAGGGLTSEAGVDAVTAAADTQTAATQAVGTTLDVHTGILTQIATNTARATGVGSIDMPTIAKGLQTIHDLAEQVVAVGPTGLSPGGSLSSAAGTNSAGPSTANALTPGGGLTSAAGTNAGPDPAVLEVSNAELASQLALNANALSAASVRLMDVSSAVGDLSEVLGRILELSQQQLAADREALEPRGTLESSARTSAPDVQLSATLAVNVTLERHTGLLQEIAQNTRRDPNAENAAARAEQTQATQAATLQEIRAMIAEAVRAQIQEQAKALAGSNGRGGVTA